ncbi:helix-turn-helix domain-containing protein [Cytobacillus firmus]|uniref:helix-turn-helix domain-containing protein n=1 Tax=Cytobacillus firmus TaxID=1399 RepID=UPI0036CA02BF
MGFHKDSLLREPRRKTVIVLEELDFIWDDAELAELIKFWERERSITWIGKYFERDPDEVLLALIHLARQDRIDKRQTGLKGE